LKQSSDDFFQILKPNKNMKLIACPSLACFKRRGVAKTLLIMKWNAIFLLAFCVQAHARAFTQTVTLSLKDAPLELAFRQINKQTGYTFIYTKSLLQKAKRVNIFLENASLELALKECFKNQPLSFTFYDKLIIIKETDARQTVMGLTISSPPPVINISGQVVDDKGDPLSGASVKIKGANGGTATDSLGRFSLTVPSERTILVISYTGFSTVEKMVGSQTSIVIQLLPQAQAMNETVVTGYQTQRKADLTGAISVVTMKDVKDIPSGNPMQSLQGRVPGLYIEADGAPSGANRRILIRGLNTLGDPNPLYIIDGVPTKRPEVLQNLNPNAIQSIQVLKDASASSIYGSRASNGVVIVTTKEAKGKNRLQIQFNSSLTAEKYTTKLSVLNTEQRGRVLWQASINDKTSPAAHSALYTYESHTDAQGNAVLDKVNIVPWLGGGPATKTPTANTDWQNEVFRTGIITSNDITLSAGNERSSFLMNLGYFNNEGMVRYTDYKRFTAVINSSTSFFDGALKIGENIQLSKSAETPVPVDLGGSNVLLNAKFLQPIIPVYTTTGEYAGPIGAGFSDRNNPLHMLDINQNDKNHAFNTFGNIYAEVRPVKNLVFRSSFGVDYTDTYSKNIEPAFTEGFLTRTINSLRNDQAHRLNLTFSNTLNYSLDVNRHRFNFLIGSEAIKEQFLNFGAYREGFALEDVNYYYLDAGTGRSTNNGSATGDQLLSFFGKLNYSFDGKYLASVTLRRDGSSRFGSNNKYAYFPAATLGWRISSEEFFRNNIDFVTDLKLRAGFGRVGNQDIGDNARFGLYRTNYGTVINSYQNTGTAYDLSGAGTGSLPSGYVSVQAENPNLKWESTDELNLGIDFGLFNNKLTGSFDYFSRKTRDILILIPYAAIEGEGRNKYLNGATKENKGMEFVLNYQDAIGAFNYNVYANVSSFHDKITYLPASVVRSYPGNIEKTILGHSQTAIFGYITDGIFQNQSEVDKHADQPGKGVGRLRYVDLNGDRKIDPLDQNWLGNQLPDFSYGLGANVSYRNFTLSFFFAGIQGIHLANGVKSSTDFVGTVAGMNYGTRTLEAWTPQNPGSTIPAVSLLNANDETRTSNYFIENASYLKLRNLQLGYNLPANTVKRLHMNDVRIYILGENLFTIMDKKGRDQFTAPDPENPANYYPRPTRFTLGVNLSL
jgi:TonB-linked SusC/RagA family outer membrane protein